MPLFKVVYWRKRTQVQLESPIFPARGYAVAFAEKVKNVSCVVTILRDSQGEDHKDNAGVFLLDTIVK